MIFIRDILIHFDIWNKIEKNFFLHFSKIHRGDPYDFGHNCKGPPYEFWKKLKKNFFLDYPRYQNGQKNPIQKLSLKVSNTMRTPQKMALLLGKKPFYYCPHLEPYFGHFS